MRKIYQVEVKLGPKWVLQASYSKQLDALHYIKEHPTIKYPRRIVRIIRTITYNEEK